MQPVTLTPQRSRALEFGIYRDGDNNLDASQAEVLAQARAVSAADSSIQFTVEDTGSRSFDFARSARYAQDDKVVSEHYTIQDGHAGTVVESSADDMASPDNLAQFVKQTLDNAEQSGAKQTWIDLVDHGAGDGGGLEADSFKGIMPMPQIAAAIAEGVKLHAQEHPEDANRNVDGVVANQCLMASMGFADALSRAGVKWLAARAETRICSLPRPRGLGSTSGQRVERSKGRDGNSIRRQVMRQRRQSCFLARRTRRSTLQRRVVNGDGQAGRDRVLTRKAQARQTTTTSSTHSRPQGNLFTSQSNSVNWHGERT